MTAKDGGDYQFVTFEDEEWGEAQVYEACGTEHEE